jgi:hypothetical protein
MGLAPVLKLQVALHLTNMGHMFAQTMPIAAMQHCVERMGAANMYDL